jgi:hypothetical protein
VAGIAPEDEENVQENPDFAGHDLNEATTVFSCFTGAFHIPVRKRPDSTSDALSMWI